MKVLSAIVIVNHNYANGPTLRVTWDSPDKNKYDAELRASRSQGEWEQREWAFRSQLGDCVSYFSYDGPGSGFGGGRFVIKMKDGTDKVLTGPWSSRAGVINNMFSEYDHCIETQTGFDATISSLQAVGICFTKHTKNNEIYYEVDLKATSPLLIEEIF